MIQLIESSPCLPYIQLLMVGVFFFILYRIEPERSEPMPSQQVESEPMRNTPNLQSEENRSVSSSLPSTATSKYCESFTFDLATGKTDFVDVDYS